MKDKFVNIIVIISLTMLLIHPSVIGFCKSEGIVDSFIYSIDSLYTAHTEQESEVIHFPDKGLENGIREHINKPEGDIYQRDVNKIKFLKINHKNISNLEGIQYLTGLEVLNLYHNEISNISPLRNLKNLKSLDLSYNQIEDISTITKLTSLDELILDSNKITDISPLEDLTNLKKLSLYNNKVKDIQPLSSLANLVDLNLYINQIDNVKPLRSLINLHKLSIGNNDITDLTPLSKLTDLTVLEAGQNRISNLKGIGSLTKLKELYLHNNQIENLDELKSLKNLWYLGLSDNRIKYVAPLGYLTNLMDLDLDKNQIVSLTGLEKLKQLKGLRLAENKIRDINGLRSLTELINLALNNNEITNVTGLSGLNNLRYLDISNNKISDISKLRNMPNLPLTSIMLGGNPLSDYVLKDVLKEQFILLELSPYIANAIKMYYGEFRQYMNDGILDIEKVGGEYRIKIRLETFTGAHNPPYGIDTMTVIKDYSGIRIEDFEHEEVPAWEPYYNEEYYVSLKYPPNWKKNPKYMEHYEGEDGFFSINAVAGGAYLKPLPIDEVVKFSAYHKLKPYGSNPQITNLKIRGQEARLITASSDQHESMNNQSELIIKYPGPVKINDDIYHYFILVADKDHIMNIAKTIKFVYLIKSE